MMRICSTFIAAACLAAPVVAEAPVAPRYDITMTVHEGDQLIGNPRLLVNAGQTARFESGEEKGNRLIITVVPSFVSADRLSLAIDADRERAIGETVNRQRVTSTVLIGLGEKAVIQPPASPKNGPPLSIAIRVARASG